MAEVQRRYFQYCTAMVCRRSCGTDDAGHNMRGSTSGLSRETRCQERWPHCGHFVNQFVEPAALLRMPPNSHTDLAKPHEHRTIHWRESTSIASTHFRGSSVVAILWIKLIAIVLFFVVRERRVAQTIAMGTHPENSPPPSPAKTHRPDLIVVAAPSFERGEDFTKVMRNDDSHSLILCAHPHVVNCPDHDPRAHRERPR